VAITAIVAVVAATLVLATQSPVAAASVNTVSAGSSHSCALFAEGSVKCWGENGSGQLGQGSTTDLGDGADEMGDNLDPIDLGTGRTATAFATGGDYTCAILDNGNVKCWGLGSAGQLGQGNDTTLGKAAGEMGDNLLAIDLGTGRTATAISATKKHTCALLDNGNVKCWGEGSSGRLGQGSTSDLGDGAGEMGDDLDPVDLGTGRTATAISAGDKHTCALLDNGNVKCWGEGSSGRLGQGSTSDLGDGAGEMGDNLDPVDLGTGRTATAISAGEKYTCALLDNGNVKCWGEGSFGRLGQGSVTTLGDGAGEMGDDLDPVDLGTGRTATAISTGHKHTCALLDNGNVKCWGLGSAGQLGQGNDTTLGKAAGEMGDNLLAIDLGTGRTATAISVGQNHTCALLDNGNVKCWGEGSSGRLGQGSSDDLGDGAGEMGDNLSVIELGAGFTLSTTTASVTEAGSTATFTVVLDTQPTSDVVLTVVSADTDEATVSPTPLTFTNGDWDTPQTVTVTGIDDSIDDGNQDTTITIAVDDDNSDNAFDGVADQTVTATTTDNDTDGYTLSTTTASVTEAGSTATFTVVLDTQPTSDVVLTVVSADTDEATVSPTPLTFTNANWNTPQTVTVTGIDDSVDDGDQDTTITIAVDDDNSDNAFDGVADQTVTATTTDNDTNGYTLSTTTASVTEAGSTATFTVVLDTQPLSDVVLTVVSADTDEATVSPTPLTFTNGDWDTPQTVTVTGIDDSIDDGDQDTTITIAVDDDNSDNAFDGVADQTVTATTTDNDTAAYTLSTTTASVTEAGSTATFTVVLDTQPTSDVVLTVVSADTDEATVSPTPLTFTNGDWDTPQTVTVTGIDDSIDDDNQDTTITIAVDDDNSDNTFDGVADQTVTATTTDNDTAAYTLSTTTASVTEAGSTATFTVVLDTQPLSDVVLTVVSADTGETTVSPATLTFTTANWDTTQTVTVTGVDDSIDDDNQDTTVTIAVDDDNSDNAFDGLADQTVTATTTDDDTVSTPGAPSAVLAVAGPQSALVTWEAPASDGGATVTTYQVDYSSDAAITWTTTATDATLSHTVEGLTAGGEYVFRVSATNSVGTGDASVASTTVTVGHSITVGYGDDLYAALLEAGDSIGDTSETFQRRAMAIADYYLDLLTYPDPIESAPDTSGPNTVTSTYTAAEYDDWVVGTATGFNVDETSGQYVASYLLVFLLTRVTR
jgi:alpha-tubulin suppressor-like RCC1 family protein